MSEHPLDWAPCGPCGTLVPRATGCVHWRPVKALARALKARATRERVSREKTKPGPHARRKTQEAVAEFHRQMGIKP